MDVTVQAKKPDNTRTIFEDAEHFAKRYFYKLMPITFETVNEKIIHIEHNYCHSSPPEEEEPNETENSATAHEESEDINYKKRKIKSSETDDDSTSQDCEIEGGESVENSNTGGNGGEIFSNSDTDDDCVIVLEPVDLNSSLPQEQKTDQMSTENESNIPKTKPDTKNIPDEKDDAKDDNQNDSNKENVTNNTRKIEVTISRPGHGGYYEPCDAFLHDLATISPDLMKNDCYEIEIVDRTQDVESNTNRTYYIVLESTWNIFENSTERIILTNDLNIGQPIESDEKYDVPRYLIFDHSSLTESLRTLSESKGGSFNYICFEIPKEQPKPQDNEKQPEAELIIISDDSSNNGNSDCPSNDVDLEAESGHSENSNCDTNTAEEGKEKVSDDCANNLGNKNYTEITLFENSDDNAMDQDDAVKKFVEEDDSDKKIEEQDDSNKKLEDNDGSNEKVEDADADDYSKKVEVDNDSGKKMEDKNDSDKKGEDKDDSSNKVEDMDNSDKKIEEKDDSNNKLEDKDETKSDQYDPDKLYDEELSQISKLLFVSGENDFTEPEDRIDICDSNSSTEPVKFIASNLTLNELLNVPIDSKGPDIEFNSESSSFDATELRFGLVKDDKFSSDITSDETNSLPQSEIRGTKRAIISEETSCPTPEKMMKLSASDEIENMTENEKVQNKPENFDELEKLDNRDSPIFSTKSKDDEESLGAEEAAKIGEEVAKRSPDNPADKEEPVKFANNKETKVRSRRTRRKISCTEIQTRSSKEVSVLRNGKKRCAPSTQASKQDKDKIDSVKSPKQKLEKTEDVPKPRRRGRKPASEGTKKICLRKRN